MFCQAFLPALDLLVSLIPHGSPIHLTSQGPALSFSAEGNHPSLTDPFGENAKTEMLLTKYKLFVYKGSSYIYQEMLLWRIVIRLVHFVDLRMYPSTEDSP